VTILKTKRLALREFRRDDLEFLLPVLGDPYSMRFYPHPFSLAECATWIERQLHRYESEGFGLWAIDMQDTGAFVGDCGPTVQMVDGIKEIELGWHVHPAYQNRGIATEAALACRDYAFGELGLERLVALVRPENLPSCRVAEKIDMHLEKETHHGSEGWVHRVYVTVSRALP
jgi:ribosomal-protein-alanine N-acetyltransferase